MMKQFIGYRTPTDIESVLLKKAGLKITGNLVTGYYIHLPNDVDFSRSTNQFVWHGENIASIKEVDGKTSFQIDLAALSKAVVINRYRKFEDNITKYRKQESHYELDVTQTIRDSNIGDKSQELNDLAETYNKVAHELILSYQKEYPIMYALYVSEFIESPWKKIEIQWTQAPVPGTVYLQSWENILANEKMNEEDFPVPVEMLEAIKEVIEKRIKALGGRTIKVEHKDPSIAEKKVIILQGLIDKISKPDLKLNELQNLLENSEDRKVLNQQRSYLSIFRTKQSRTDKMVEDIKNIVKKS